MHIKIRQLIRLEYYIIYLTTTAFKNIENTNYFLKKKKKTFILYFVYTLTPDGNYYG